jgi:hypothetical protein
VSDDAMNRGFGPELEGDELEPLSDLARAWAAASPQSPGGAAAWTKFDAGMARHGRRRRVHLAVAGAVALVLGAGVGRHLWPANRGERLTYAVEGAAARTDGYIPRVAEALARVRFSDGTEVGLERGSRAWVVATGAEGAQLRLEDGRAHFSVVHRPHARWSVEAGPFVVSVTGTKFDVEWSGANDLLRVHLLNGVVTVGGPQTRGGVTLLPGQVLEARPDEGILRIEPAPLAALSPAATPPLPSTPPVVAASPGEPYPRPAPALAGEPSSPVPVSPAERKAPGVDRLPRPAAARGRALALATAPPLLAEVGNDWGRQIARGDFQRILREADASGTEACLRSLPSDRLAALGDAARYAGRRDLARRVLLSQRTRFAGSAAASEATFLLGRLAEDGHQPDSAALPWYERYLAEAPAGVYAAEALGRQMLILGERADDLRAREIARKYLERYPRGAYVVQAREILEGAP